MIEKQVAIARSGGDMGTFVCHPERGGPYPVIIIFMDAPGIREELRDMARRLAATGYYVLLPNLYYREKVEELGAFIGEANMATRTKMFGLMETVTIANVMEDTGALIVYAKEDPMANTAVMGCVGYCMSGQFAISAAANYPANFKSAASIYGVRLMTDRADSPHLSAPRAKAELYVGFAETDQYVPLDILEPLAKSFRDANVKAEVELYPGVEHGFAFPQRPAYNRDAAERHWERLLSLFARTLGSH